jgi:Tol biopolymer transport system component
VQTLRAAGSRDGSFPGGDGLIAFSYESPVPGANLTQNDIFVIAADGSGRTQLTRTPFRHEFAPAWSPDGSRIAFWRSKAPFGHGSIWTMAAEGSDPVRLTSGIDGRDPAWSPDVRRIVFTLFDGRGGPDLATIRAADGSGLRRLTRWHSREFEPALSPDGTTIAFTRGFALGDVGNIWTIDLATRHAARITSSPGYDHQVAWSPDGATLIFERVTSFTTAKLVIAAPDGSGLAVLTRGAFDADPAFAPSGSRIVFASDRGGSFFPDLWTTTPAGADLEPLLDLAGASMLPDQQPVAP